MSRLIRLWQRMSPAAAFEACLGAHLERLWRLAVRLQGNPDDAEDLMQELLERAWRNQDELLALDKAGPWLARVLYRLHVDRWRRRGVLGDAVAMDDLGWETEPSLVSGDQTVLAAVETDEVLRAVQSLPEQQRTVLLLHDGEGYTLEEVGEIVGAPVGTIKSRLHRARAAARDCMNDGTKSGSDACIAVEGKTGERP